MQASRWSGRHSYGSKNKPGYYMGTVHFTAFLRDIVVDPYELQRVNRVIESSQNAERRRKEEMDKKLAMHEASMAKVSKWDNTIAGQRKRRLAAQDERNKRLEEQRQRVDEEWRQVREMERNELVQRAKHMQYLNDSRVRQFNSQALISQVLKEREAQIEHKHAADDRAHRKEMEHAQAMRDNIVKQESASRAASAERRAKRCELAGINRTQGEAHRTLEVDETQRLRQWAAAQDEAAAREVAELQHKKVEAKAALADDLARHLGNSLVLRKEREAQAMSEEAQMLKSNADLARIKDTIARRRREVEKQVIREREVRNRHVAELQVPAMEAKVAERTVFLEKIEAAHKGELEKRKAKEADIRKQQLDDCIKVSKEMVKSKQQRAQLEVEANLQVRRYNEGLAVEERKSNEDRKQRDRQVRGTFGDEYRKQMRDHAEKDQLAREGQAQAHMAALMALQDEDAAFHQYGVNVISELKSYGNDTVLVERKLRDLETTSRATYAGLLNHATVAAADKPLDGSNTFDRLGLQWS
ncbi:hypothetical protein RI367_001016 [Sorochytrium milnesiophthora]